MTFERFEAVGLTGYAARHGKWQFLILQDMGTWTASYRLVDPREPVSASSTIMGPFDSYREAEIAAHNKLRELKGLA